MTARRESLAVAAVLAIACSRAPAPAPEPEQGAAELPAPVARDAAPPLDAPAVVSLTDALARLRDGGRDRVADVIARRVDQTARKMKLTEEEGTRAAVAATELTRDHPGLAALAEVMPRSTVELCRAVTERGVPAGDADDIARYLVELTRVMQFGRLATFDDNHSHVTGRDWDQIDYSGEGMTWQKQKAFWAPRGVPSFKRADFVHAYFVGAEKMEHFARVYHPRGRMKDVPPPTSKMAP